MHNPVNTDEHWTEPDDIDWKARARTRLTPRCTPRCGMGFHYKPCLIAVAGRATVDVGEF